MGCSIPKQKIRISTKQVVSTEFDLVKDFYKINQNLLPRRIRQLFENYLSKLSYESATADLKFISLTGIALKSLKLILPHYPNLQKLDLWKTHLKDEGLKLVSSLLIHFPNLKFLSIADNNIGYDGLWALTKKFGILQELENLQMHLNRFTPESTNLLADSLNDLQNLQILCLDECDMKGEELKKLIFTIGHIKNIEKVMIDYNVIGKNDDFFMVEVVSKMEKLRRFSLKQCDISENTQRSLKEARPDIIFTFT